MNLIIDIGNTCAKLAVFEQGEIMEVLRCSNQSLSDLTELCKRYTICKGIMSSVISLNDTTKLQLHQLPFPILEFTYQTPIPITNLYQTPQTLGTDRLAAVIAAYTLNPQHPNLVIDAGTCITYDFIDEHGKYHGGNISPGMDMRFKALHEYTEKLPKVKPCKDIPNYGQTTETAIQVGVIRGIEHEICGYIRQLQQKYPNLFVFLTGGNVFSFDKSLKIGIFADDYLVLKGLNKILEYNDTL